MLTVHSTFHYLLILFLFTHCLFLGFMMNFTQQFCGAAHGSRERCRYPQLWSFMAIPQWLQSLNLKSEDLFYLSLSSYKYGWVFASGHSYQESDKGRAGELDMSWDGKSLGNVGYAARNYNVDCHLTLKCSKVHILLGHINFYFLSLIFLLSSCSK